MRKISLQLLWKRGIILLLVAASILSLVPTTTVSADKPGKYSWGQRPQNGTILPLINITEIDGKKATGQLVPARTSAGTSTSNDIFVGFYNSHNPGFLGIGDGEECSSNMYVQLTGDNSGRLIAKPDNVQPSPSAKPSCKNYPGIGATITITGTRPKPPETAEEKKILVRIWGSTAGKQPILTIKSPDGSTNEYAVPNKGPGYWWLVLTSDPGRNVYVFGCKPGGPIACGQSTRTKEPYEPLTVDLGESPQSKQVTFRLFIDCSVVKEDEPWVLTIFNDKQRKVFDEQVGLLPPSTITDPYPPLALSSGCLRPRGISKAVTLEQGSYQGCIVERKYCDQFTKVFARGDRIDLYFGFDGIPKDDPACLAGLFGWLFCPLAEFMRNLTETIARIVESLMYMEPITLKTTSDNPIYGIWSLVRDIANIAFVILFLFLIFSQATSMGMSNYGIKRLLPRLLIMAVLVNISYFICAFALDVANLLGAGVKGIIQYGIDAAPEPNLGKEKWDGSYAGFIAGIFALIVAAITIPPIWTLFTMLFTTIALIIITGFVLLVFRQVAITLLIILSPLAFVAALLPNTASWFTKWRQLFIKLLISYPVVMFTLYGSILVSVVLQAAMAPAPNP